LSQTLPRRPPPPASSKTKKVVDNIEGFVANAFQAAAAACGGGLRSPAACGRS